jgi:hypothetical protein
MMAVRAAFIPAASRRVEATALTRAVDGQRTEAAAPVVRTPRVDAEPDLREVRRLQQIDQGVRAHEAAHLAAAGGLASGGASYDFVTGPDGRLYAIGGAVRIDTSEGTSPEETLAKAKQIQQAALAPADPSAQDMAVAAAAAQMEALALLQLAQERRATRDDELARTTPLRSLLAEQSYGARQASPPALSVFG